MKICLVSTKMPFYDVRVYYKEILSLQKKYKDITYICPASANGYLEDMSYRDKTKLDDNNEQVVAGLKVKAVRKKKEVAVNYFLDKIFSKFKVFYELIFRPFDPEYYRLALSVQADIYQCEEVDSYFACLKVKRTLAKQGRKVKVIFDCQEFWQASKYDDFANFPILRDIARYLMSRIERKIAYTADYIIACNQIERANFVIFNRFVKTDVIFNAATAVASNIQKTVIPGFGQNDLILVHEGFLYFNRGLKMILAAMKELVRADKNIKLLIIGDVFNREKEYYEQFLQNNQELKQNIVLTGWIDFLDLPKYLAAAQLGLITMDPGMMNNMLAGPPNKVFNYLASGLPVLSVDFPEIRGILTEYNCGILFEPGDQQMFVNKVLSIKKDLVKLKELKENTQKAFAKYNWAEMEKKLFNIYQELAV